MDNCPPLTRFAYRIASFLFALGAGLVLAGGKDWNITPLPSLPSERPFSIAEGVNNRGDIVGWSYIYDATINSNRSYAVLWQNGVVRNLGEGNAQAVNDRGTIVGSIPGGLSVWRDGHWTRLGVSAGAPFAINAFDSIAGWFVGGLSHAYLYQRGVLQDLGTLGGSDSAATSLNIWGQVVGYAKIAGDANYHAFLYQRGVMKDLGTLGGGNESRAHDINNWGVVVGEAWDAHGNALPFIHDGVMRRLFTAPGCCVVPRAINDFGAVVGTIDGNASFIYENRELTRLESIPAVRAAGWTQLIPTDISERGWIVGMGRQGPLLPPAQQEWKAFLLKRGR